MFNRDIGIVKWCRLCDRVSRPVGGSISMMLFDSSSAFKGLPI